MEKPGSSNGSAPRMDSIDLDQGKASTNLTNELFRRLSEPCTVQNSFVTTRVLD
jgi:hypothetical protein